MVDQVSKEEFKSLEARVGTLEREVEGEKMVTRYILEQVRRNGDDLAAVKTRLDRVEGRLDGVEGRLDRVEAGLQGLRNDLPQIVGDTMRAVLREKGNS